MKKICFDAETEKFGLNSGQVWKFALRLLVGAPLGGDSSNHAARGQKAAENSLSSRGILKHGGPGGTASCDKVGVPPCFPNQVFYLPSTGLEKPSWVASPSGDAVTVSGEDRCSHHPPAQFTATKNCFKAPFWLRDNQHRWLMIVD